MPIRNSPTYQIPPEADEIVRRLVAARRELAATNKTSEAEATIAKLTKQLERAKRLFIVGDLTEGEYEQEKLNLNRLIASERVTVAPPPYDADALIGKLRHVGEILANKNDPQVFKRAVRMLFEKLEVTKKADGTWELTKISPKEEFRDFF